MSSLSPAIFPKAHYGAMSLYIVVRLPKALADSMGYLPTLCTASSKLPLYLDVFHRFRCYVQHGWHSLPFSRGSFRHSSPPSCVLRGGRSRLPRPSSSSCFCPSSVLTFRCRASWHRGHRPGTCLFPRPPPAICCSFVCRLLLCGRSFALYARCGRATTQQPHSVTALNSGPLSP